MKQQPNGFLAEEHIDQVCSQTCSECAEGTPHRFNDGTWVHQYHREGMVGDIRPCTASSIRERQYQLLQRTAECDYVDRALDEGDGNNGLRS